MKFEILWRIDDMRWLIQAKIRLCECAVISNTMHIHRKQYQKTLPLDILYTGHIILANRMLSNPTAASRQRVDKNYYGF